MVVNVMLGGELFILTTISVTLTYFTYIMTSHHDRLVACHVSAIPKNACLSRCSIPGHPDRLRSNNRTRNASQGFFSG